MPQSIEPTPGLGRRLVVGGLIAALVLTLGLLVYQAMWGLGSSTDTITPAELRAVLSRYRDNRRDRMIDEVQRMRDKLAQMQRIRNQWLGQVQIPAATAGGVLDGNELQFRALAQRPLDTLPFHEVYDTARAVEQETITLYREFLAARMVGLRPGLDYHEAYEQAQTPRPQRSPLATAALYRDVTTVEPGGGLEELKAEVKRSTVECREMADNCERLLSFTRKATGQTGDGLTPDMGSHDPAMIGYRGEELLPDEMDFTHRPDVGDFAAIPGRRLVSGGATSEWMYVDTWYIIGPFAHDRRRELLDVRFGPEANVNLDDSFEGKPNSRGERRKLRWEYKKTGWAEPTPPRTAWWVIEPRSVESYGIWYAFTEIYSDAPREVWIATGSDDYGKLWINDELVWRSPKERKPFNATENIQLVKLKQGQNKVLVRIENAGGTMGFSLMIRLKIEE